MTREEAYAIIVDEGDQLHRMPRREHSARLSRRDYIRGRLLLMVARDTMYRAEYEAPEY